MGNLERGTFFTPVENFAREEDSINVSLQVFRSTKPKISRKPCSGGNVCLKRGRKTGERHRNVEEERP